MKKYVCTGSCHGESRTPGTCQAKDCEMYGKPLVEINVPESGRYPNTSPIEENNADRR